MEHSVIVTFIDNDVTSETTDAWHNSAKYAKQCKHMCSVTFEIITIVMIIFALSNMPYNN